MKYWKEVGELLKGWLSEGGWREGRAWEKTLRQDSHLCLGNHLGACVAEKVSKVLSSQG